MTVGPIIVKDIRDYYTKWLTLLNSIFKLREITEIPVLASYLALYSKYSNYENKDTLYQLMFSDKTSEMLQKNLNVSSKSFNKSVTHLKEKKMIIDNKLNSQLLYPILKKDYNINIVFKELNEKGETSYKS